MPIGPARMPLMEHLGELRMRLVRIFAVLLVAVIVFYMATPTLIQFLMIPIGDSVGIDPATGAAQLYVLDPFEGFSVRFLVSFWASIVATSPVILWQIIAFFLPALKPKERKWFMPTFAAATALFIFGTIFCYLVILSPAFDWLVDQSAGVGLVQARLSTYVDIIIKFELGFGVAFELPIVIFYLVIFDVVPYKKLRNSWRYVYVGLLTFSAIVTPDANPVTMGLMFAALIVLYEASLMFARVVLARRIKRQNAELAGEEAAERAAEGSTKKAVVKKK